MLDHNNLLYDAFSFVSFRYMLLYMYIEILRSSISVFNKGGGVGACEDRLALIAPKRGGVGIGVTTV